MKESKSKESKSSLIFSFEVSWDLDVDLHNSLNEQLDHFLFVGFVVPVDFLNFHFGSLIQFVLLRSRVDVVGLVFTSLSTIILEWSSKSNAPDSSANSSQFSTSKSPNPSSPLYAIHPPSNGPKCSNAK